MTAYDDITSNIQTKHDMKIVFGFLVSFPDTEAIARYNHAKTIATTTKVHKATVVLANVISWKSHKTVRFSFVVHTTTLYTSKLHWPFNRQSVLIFIHTSERVFSHTQLLTVPGQHNVCQLYVYIRLDGQVGHTQPSNGYGQQ